MKIKINHGQKKQIEIKKMGKRVEALNKLWSKKLSETDRFSITFIGGLNFFDSFSIWSIQLEREFPQKKDLAIDLAKYLKYLYPLISIRLSYGKSEHDLMVIQNTIAIPYVYDALSRGEPPYGKVPTSKKAFYKRLINTDPFQQLKILDEAYEVLFKDLRPSPIQKEILVNYFEYSAPCLLSVHLYKEDKFRIIELDEMVKTLKLDLELLYNAMTFNDLDLDSEAYRMLHSFFSSES
jgi:hypothetical protein